MWWLFKPSICSKRQTQMVCFKKKHVLLAANVITATVKTLILKVILGVFDVGSDIVNGSNFLSGQFMLGLYFASRTREEYNLLTNSASWGYQTICLPWLPGLLRIAHLASKAEWTTMTCGGKFKRIGGYFLMLLAWPLFSPLM